MQHYVRLRYLLQAIVLLFLMVAGIGCQANTSQLDEQGLLPHLVVELHLPDDLESEHTSNFEATVRMNEHPVDDAEVSFVFWTETMPDNKKIVKASALGNGRYSASYTVGGAGLYLVQTRAIKAEMEAKPAKRFAIGELAVLELAAREAKENEGITHATQTGGGGHHH